MLPACSQSCQHAPAPSLMAISSPRGCSIGSDCKQLFPEQAASCKCMSASTIITTPERMCCAPVPWPLVCKLQESCSGIPEGRTWQPRPQCQPTPVSLAILAGSSSRGYACERAGRGTFLTRGHNISVLLRARRGANLRKSRAREEAAPCAFTPTPGGWTNTRAAAAARFVPFWAGRAPWSRCCRSTGSLSHPLQQKVQPLPISRAPPSAALCSPRCVDPDDVQVTEVDAFLIQPAVAGTSLAPRPRGQVRLGRGMAQTCSKQHRERGMSSPSVCPF